jgi:hypothetical protein
VIPSGYRITFVVLVTRLAGELLTQLRHRARRCISLGVRKASHVREPLGVSKNSFTNGFGLIEVGMASPTAGEDLRLQLDGKAGQVGIDIPPIQIGRQLHS